VVAFPYVEYYEKLARLRGIENYTQFAVTFGQPDAQRRRKVTQL